MEYIIYSDESDSKGDYYSDFFGGVLVRSTDFDMIKEIEREKKPRLSYINRLSGTKAFASE